MEAKKTAVDYLEEGDRLLESGTLEEAIAAYRRAIELNPDLSWSHHNLGEALAKLGQFEEAIPSYRRAIELNPDFSWSYHHLGDALERRQQWEEAVVVFRKAIELNADHFGSYVGLGKNLEKVGQLDEAIAAYRRASELEPDADWIQYRLGEVLQQRTQLDLEGAIASYRRAIELNADDVQAYRKLLQIQPDNFEVWLQLGEALVKQEQWEQAIAPYRRLTELNPDDVRAHYRLGELLIKQGDLEGAIDTLRHALEQSPNSDESYYNLGEALAAQGNTTEASLCYYKAFKLNPNNMQANQKRPRIYDCFAFFNELDVLRIRIEELKDVVDKFILVEATKTFSGNPKPLYYQEFSHEFAEYQDKIIHYVVDDMPEIDYSQPVNLQAWPLDVHQKNCISRVLNSLDCKDEDIILVNDCDEIPRKERLSEAIELLKDNEFVIFVQDLYHGHLNNLASEWWCGTVACKYKDFKVRTYTKVRYSDKINTGLDMGDPAYKRAGYINRNQYFEHPYLLKSGWSFSWFGSELSRRYKLQSFAHKEGDDSQARGIEKIKYDVCRPSLEMEASGEFYFDVRDIEGKDVPGFLRKNILKYRHFLQPRQTALMAKIGGDFKQVETQLNLLKNEAIKVKFQLEKSIQNLLKVCDTLAERGNIVEAIAQWRQLVELYPEFTSKKCFLSNLDGIKTFRINPEDYTLISGQLLQTQAGQQLVSQTGNNGQICYGPYISLPAGLYRVKLYLENSDYSGNPEGSNSGKVWFKFDVAVSKAVVIYQENVYNNHQAEHEFFIDVNVQDLEIRFWATGLFFAVNFIELNLIYQTDLQKDIEAYQQKPSTRKIEKIEVKDAHTNYGQFIYAEWNHPNEISRDLAAAALYCLQTERWGQYILPGTIAIDIGAHSGDTALPMAILTGSTGMVLAFEPNPYVYEILKFNQYLNRNSLNIEIFDLAIMEKEGTYEFTYGDSECCNGGYDDLFGWKTTNPNVRVIPIKGVNLATFLQAQFGQEYDNILKRLSFIKIDCEGYDKEVIKTLKPIIDVAKPALFVEWFINFNQEQTDDLFQSIYNLGYACYNPVTLEVQEADIDKKIPDLLCLPNRFLETQSQSNLIEVKHKGEIYDSLWHGINQAEVLASTQDLPIEVRLESAYEHFSQTSSYKVIPLFSLTEDDRALLEEKGFGINNLELIGKEDKELEDKYISYFSELTTNNNGAYPIAIHQHSLLTTGYVYTVSPFTGDILRSNHSFVVNYWEIGHHDLQAFCYRFVGEKVFYLIVGGMGSEKTGIYIPELEIIIVFVAAMQTAQIDETINKLKSYMVSYWPPVKSYILNTYVKPLVNVIGLFYNISHYVWNELGGIDIIKNDERIQKVVDKFLVGPGDYFSAIDIFPEVIPQNKLIEVKDDFDAFKVIVDNNYLSLRIVGSYITQELINKIIQVSVTKCSPNFLEQVHAAKQKCFPLLGIQFRTSSRVWLSQVEGLANIIKKLYEEFENLGIVFDGWSSIPGQEYSSEVAKINIERDKAVEEQIKNLIPSSIPTYSAIGATTYETVVWWHRAIDAGIEPLSAGLIFSSWIADKPGVVHSREDFYHGWLQAYTTPYCRENLVGAKIFVGADQDCLGDYNSNYDCSWERIYNEILPILNNLNKNKVKQMLGELEKATSDKQKQVLGQQINANLTKVNDLEWAIAQWRKAIEISSELNRESCFLSNVEGIKTWRITPEQLVLHSGQMVSTPQGSQVVSGAGNKAQLNWGPGLTLPDGLYRVKIDFNWLEATEELSNKDQKIGLNFDLVTHHCFGIYLDHIYISQEQHEFFIDLLDAQTLEIRFWPIGVAFAINFVDLALLVEHNNDKNVSHYINLGKHLQIKGETNAARAYHKAAELNLGCYLTETLGDSQQQSNYGYIYEKIWNFLNQLNISNKETENLPTEINREQVSKYFNHTYYRVMTLDALSKQDVHYLADLGINLGNLMVNRQARYDWEQIYIKKFQDAPQSWLGKVILPLECHQQSLLETGFMYAICPFTGRILRSNQSFVINHIENPAKQRGHDLQGFIYRFVGQEVFYLMVGCPHGSKLLLYFPQEELIINLNHSQAHFASPIASVNKLKSYMVSSWQKVRRYISTPDKQVVDVIGLGFNIGHYLWQDLAGIDILLENEMLNKIERVLTGPGDYFSSRDIFPEIPADKFIEVENVSEVFQTVIENNYVALRVNANLIKERLIDTVRKSSLKKCSTDFLTYIEKVRQAHHYPILGVQIRGSGRVWSSQVTGIANIINRLFLEYPDLAIVFDGWSVTGQEDSSSSCWSMIEQEKEVMTEIMGLINSNILSYSAIGCTTFETIAWWTEVIDLHISPNGSGLTYGSWIANKPGVVHGPISTYWTRSLYTTSTQRENLRPQVFVPEEHIIDQGDGSYDCDWTVIYNEVIKILKQFD